MKKIYLTMLVSFLALPSALYAQVYANKIVFSLASPTPGMDSICTINADGNGFTFVTHGARPRVSNSKNTIAYAQGTFINRYNNDIYFKEGNGTPYVFFDNNEQRVVNYDFSPNDHYFIYDWDGGMYFTESDNPNGQSLAGSCSGSGLDLYPRISPNDSAIVRSSPTYGLYLMPVLQTNCDQIPNTVGDEFCPYWSADGQWIYFLRKHTNAEGMHNIFKIKRDGSSLTQITNFSAADTLGMSLVITKNGKWAVAPARINGVVGIYKFRLNGPNNFGYLVKPFSYLHTPMETLWLGSVDSISDDMTMNMVEMDEMDVQTYPNPTTGYIQVNWAKNITGNIRLYNSAGVLVREEKVQNTHTFGMDISPLAKGVYMIQGIADGQRFSKRIIKQ